MEEPSNPKWYTWRSARERGLTIITASLFLVCTILAISIFTVNKWHISHNEASVGGGGGDVCTTQACIHIASNVLKSMDKTVDPCDDFYQFACGRFLNSTIIPEDRVEVNNFIAINDKVSDQLKMSLDEPSFPGEPKTFKFPKMLYKSCMNTTTIEAQGLDPILGVLKKLGGWPVLEGNLWNEDGFDWIQSTFKFKDMGYSLYFFDTHVDVDFRNSSKRALYVDQPYFGLAREYLSMGLEDETVKAYYNYMVDIAVILGAERTIAEQQLLSALKFEIALANITSPHESRRDSTLLYNPITIAQLSKTFSSIPWKKYFNRLLPPHVKVDRSEVIILSAPSYIADLEVLIRNTPKRVQANYAMWRAVSSSVVYLNEVISKQHHQYLAVLNGNTERIPRWRECLSIVSTKLSVSIGAIYVRKYFHKETKNHAMEMVDNIRKQFYQVIQRTDWMDDVTKRNALDKVVSMANHVGYPDEILDDEKIDEVYEGLDLNDNGYLQSILNTHVFATKISFGLLKKPVEGGWVNYANPAVVNAFYSSKENSLQLPASILQGVLFSSDSPSYMNYGAIGYIVGHEITHGFDDQGRQFDKDGNLLDWWATATAEKYLEKAQCIINQYGNYTVKAVRLHLNGVNTQGENIADNGGIKAAYLAYKNWANINGQEQMLPGLPYNPQQMFWISAATMMCSVLRPEILRSEIVTAFHSPSEFRILGPLSNTPEFSSDFKCPLGSKMNPAKKCTVW